MISLKSKLSKNIKTLEVIRSEVENINHIALSVDCVIFGFDENKLRVLLMRSDLKKYQSKWSLLGDLVKPEEDLDNAAYRILKQRTGLDDAVCYGHHETMMNEPLITIYESSSFRKILKNFNEKKYSLRLFLHEANTCMIFPDNFDFLKNVNDIKTYQKAKELLTAKLN